MQKFIFTLVVFASISMSSLVMAQRSGGEDGAQRGGQRGGAEGGQRGGMRGGGGQRGMRGGGGGGGGGQRPVSPLMAALDADKDGKLSAEEIKNAVTALKALDKNEDGVLEATELAPARPERGGRGGAGGGGFDPSAMVDRIMERDADKDGKLTKEEAGERMAGAFDNVDADKDGFLTREEVVEMTKQWTGGGGRGGRGGGRGGDQPKSKDSRPKFDDN